MRTLLLGLVNFITGIVEIFLTMRFLLRLFGASTVAPFVQFIYDSSGVLLEPFRGIFPTRVVEPGHALEFSTLFAILIYALVAYLLIELINWFAPPRRVLRGEYDHPHDTHHRS